MENATIEEILSRAKEITGKRISELDDSIVSKNTADKGLIGQHIQEFGFYIRPNSDSRPDFIDAKVELKVLPLLRYKAKEGFRIKERTKVCLINYQTIINESWEKSHARRKIEKILFVFYEFDQYNLFESIIRKCYLYDLGSRKNDEILLCGDWNIVKNKVIAGEAHLLSERLTKALAASRAGAGKGKDAVKQPNSTIEAETRAFSLKPSFTRVLWGELNKTGFDHIFDKYAIKGTDDIQDLITEKLRKLEGKNLVEISSILGLPLSKSKSSAASILKAALGFSGKKPIKEIEQLGLIVKVIPVNLSDDTPWEAMSFPYQPLNDILSEEEFEDSLLHSYLNGIIIIPVYRETSKRTSPDKEVAGKAFIWNPTDAEMYAIKQEWQAYKTQIAVIDSQREKINNQKGYKIVTNLSNESQTSYIHIRPHARDSSDLDPSLPKELEISKQSFWLNKSFLKSLILANK